MSMRETERRRVATPPPMAVAAQGKRLDDVLRVGASAARTGQGGGGPPAAGPPGGAWQQAMRSLNPPSVVPYPSRNGMSGVRSFQDGPRAEDALADSVRKLLHRDEPDAPTFLFEGLQTTYHLEDGKLKSIDVMPTEEMQVVSARFAQPFSIVPIGRRMSAGRYTGWAFEVRFADQTVDVYESAAGGYATPPGITPMGLPDYSEAKLVSSTKDQAGEPVRTDEYEQRAQNDSKASAFLIRLMIYTAGFLAALDFAARKTLR